MNQLIFFICIFAYLLLSSSCSQKTSDEVFPVEVEKKESFCSGRKIAGQYLIQWEDGHFSTQKASSREALINNFIEPNLDKIKFVESDRRIQIQSSPSSRSALGNSNTPDQEDQWYLSKIQAQDVWNEKIYGENVIVGVIDTFVDYTNKQLKNQILINEKEIPNNEIDDDQNGVVDDYYFGRFVSGDLIGNENHHSHGTHVAGIIAANPLEGEISGIAPQSKIVSATFMDNSGGGSLSDAIQAIEYTVSRGAKIINASWGDAPCVQSLYNEFESLYNRGVLVVVAAGNGDPYNNRGIDIDSQPIFPAAMDFPNQVTVAASSQSDFMTSWSNRGWRTVHLAAPGEYIKSTVLNNEYDFYDGTSMAAPIVSGAAALLWGAFPQASAVEIKQALISSVEILPDHEFKVKSSGRLNIKNALIYLQRLDAQRPRF